MKTAIILTGHHEPTAERYQGLQQDFVDAGWEGVHIYNPNWKRHSVAELVDDFVQQLPHNSQPLTLFGFSLGAMIALIASVQVSTQHLILASPSGYFSEYEPLLSSDDAAWADEHLNDYKDFSARKILSTSTAQHGYLLAGEKELAQWHDFKQWMADVQTVSHWPLQVVPQVGHEIEAIAYQQTAQDIIQNLV